MPRLCFKIHDEKFNKDYYLEWSSVVDSFITHGMSLEEYKEYYIKEYGNSYADQLNSDIERIEKTGSNSRTGFTTLADILENNCCGENDEKLNLEEILDQYCRE
jgi:N6-adenosine-specific RNA methylase IME4